jgi:hypothetical protein
VKLPAAVAFPTDDRLIKRLEESRRALPQNNMKALRKHREPPSSFPAAVHRVREPDSRPVALQLVRIDELYLRNKVLLGQR